MRKSVKDFMAFYATATKKGVTVVDHPQDDDGQICNILASFFEEPVMESPDYQFKGGCEREMSNFLEERGYHGITPVLKIEDKKMVKDYYRLLYSEDGSVYWLNSGDVYMVSTVSNWKSVEDFNALIENFSIEEDPEYINNFGEIYCDPKGQRLVSSLVEGIKRQDTTVIKNYEFDDEIQELIKKPGSGSFIFHGEPGGGKSSYIRYLAQTNPNLEFFTCSVVTLLGEGGIRYLGRYLTRRYSSKKRRNESAKDIVIVIEDSEKLLQDRAGNGGNNAVPELLNKIDGTTPSGEHAKYIFTFNQKVSKVDTAMLRKGRLLKIVEFMKLQGESLKEAAEKFGVNITEAEVRSGLTVADLVYHDHDNGYNSSKKLGF